MIRLVNRYKVLANQTFANFIHSWQKIYDPTNDIYMKTEGVYYDIKLKEERFFNQKECNQLQIKDIEDYHNSIDNINPTIQNQVCEKIFNIKYRDTFIYSIELGKTMERLSTFLNSNIFFFIELKTPWLYQNNEYEPVKNALNYLKSLGIDKKYTGGIESNGEDLEELTTNIFWIIRCNAALPNIWFCDSKNKFVGDLCMYGNLHFHIFDENTEAKITSFARQENLKKINECEEEFGEINEYGTIKGRQTIPL